MSQPPTKMIDPAESQLPTLHAKRVTLRWLKESDVRDLYAIFSDPEVARYWSEAAYTEEGQAKELLDRIRTSFASRSLFQWGVVRPDENRVIGTVTLASLDTQNRRAELGFALNRDEWGSGLMSEAVAELVRFAFENLELHRLEADIDPRNDASIRLVERLGFQREGLLRERWIVAGEINDTVLYGLLAREWQAG